MTGDTELERTCSKYMEELVLHGAAHHASATSSKSRERHQEKCQHYFLRVNSMSCVFVRFIVSQFAVNHCSALSSSCSHTLSVISAELLAQTKAVSSTQSKTLASVNDTAKSLE